VPLLLCSICRGSTAITAEQFAVTPRTIYRWCKLLGTLVSKACIALFGQVDESFNF
jgi:hypothetical protein